MKSKTAFSLVEIAVVLVVVGILVSGLMQGNRMVKKSRLATAQTLTQSSPVIDIANLSIWYETTLKSSFNELEAKDNTQISTWYDNNPKGIKQYNATQATSTNQPKYFEDVLNGALPVVRFDGVDNFLDFDASSLIGTAYTIFIVEQRRVANSDHLPFIGGTVGLTNNNLHLTYRNNTTVAFAQYNNDLDITVPGYTVPLPRMHTFMLNTSTGKFYWQNGGAAAYGTAAQTATMTNFPGSSIGQYMGRYFNGDIAEIIIFTRALKTNERQMVENYLSKKYNITIS